MAAHGVLGYASIRASRWNSCADTVEPMRSIYRRSDDVYQEEGPMQAIIRVFFVLALAAAGTAFAQGYPTKPIKLVVPWPPGQATDLYARLVADKLSQALGQPLIVDNRAGAGGTIGSDVVARSAADGYTLLAASSGPISTIPNVQTVPYDPLKAFAPISLTVIVPYVLVTGPSFPAANVKELIALVKANPEKYAFSSSGTGATSHLVSELFHSMAGIAPTHVPYKGSAPSLTDVMSGQVSYTFETVASVLPYVKSGRLKAYGVSTAKRAATMPDVPTIAEAADLPGFDIAAWGGFLAPANTPREIVNRLGAETLKALQSPGTSERLAALGMEVQYKSPDEFAAFLVSEHARYGAIAKKANVRLD
jgi:tripartite-type tricarboxylate transporter receptor subunit TctC